MKLLLKTLATGLGIGYLPVFSGTAATLLGIPIFLGLAGLNLPLYLLTVTAFTVFSVWVADRALPFFSDAKRPHDPSRIVIDEVAGFLWAAGTLRFVAVWRPEEGRWDFLILAFVFFRVMDISKWWPVGWVERKFPNSVGIVLDDVAAGVAGGALAILFCIVYPLVVYLFAS